MRTANSSAAQLRQEREAQERARLVQRLSAMVCPVLERLGARIGSLEGNAPYRLDEGSSGWSLLLDVSRTTVIPTRTGFFFTLAPAPDRNWNFRCPNWCEVPIFAPDGSIRSDLAEAIWEELDAAVLRQAQQALELAQMKDAESVSESVP